MRKGVKEAMNKAELTARVAETSGIDKKTAEKAVAAVFDVLTKAMEAGEKVHIMGFGAFEVRERAERPGRNPATGESIMIPASKTPVFKPSKTLKTR